MAFSRNVFINCPFDEEYKPLLRAMIFTIIYLDFEPKISETLSSFTIRIDQIKKYIRSSKLAIHDLSRSRPLKRNDLPRFSANGLLTMSDYIKFARQWMKKFKP